MTFEIEAGASPSQAINRFWTAIQEFSAWCDSVEEAAGTKEPGGAFRDLPADLPGVAVLLALRQTRLKVCQAMLELAAAVEKETLRRAP